MIPTSLTQWTADIIVDLLTKGYYETDSFDFKEKLPHPSDDKGKLRLTKSCASFANSGGGFLVFGVADDKSLPPADRLVGLAPTLDFPEHFGVYPQRCMPSVNWTFCNPPLQLLNGNVVHVVYIPKSANAPHTCQGAQDGLLFMKRTNKGDEFMTYEEIRLAFLQYYEKRVKLQLLRAELQALTNQARSFIISEDQRSSGYSLGSLDVTVIETVLADIYTIIADNVELLETLYRIRGMCRTINNKTRIFYSQVALPLTNVESITKSHNDFLEPRCQSLIAHCDHAVVIIDTILKM